MSDPTLSPLVLVVDDVPHGREICVEYLEWRGFRVATASDGLGAVDQALVLRPDVILMDLRLPVLDGWEATRLLKRSRRTRAIPVVAITADGTPNACDRARDAGCAAVMVKPCPPGDIEAEVRRQIAGAHSA